MEKKLNLSNKVCNAIISCIFNVISISPDFAIIYTRPLELNAIVYLCQTKAFNGPGGHNTLKYHPLPRRKQLVISTSTTQDTNQRTTEIQARIGFKFITQVSLVIKTPIISIRCLRTFALSSHLLPLPHQMLTQPCPATNAPC